jgi:regulator of extracellular matrix RemA (YlzA/DUF370 family)
MAIDLISVGFGSAVVASRIIAILSPDSAPVRRMIKQAEDENLVISMTYGRKTRSVIVLDTGHLALSALQPETVINRLRHYRGPREQDDDEQPKD